MARYDGSADERDDGAEKFSSDLQSFDDAATKVAPLPLPPAGRSFLEPEHHNPPVLDDHADESSGLVSQSFSAKMDGDLVVGKNIPGRNASTLRIHSIWKSMCRLVFKSGCTFSIFLQKLVKWPGLRSTSPTASCWPMPLPHFSVFQKGSKAAEGVDDGLLIAISLQVAYLNWLFLGKPVTPPEDICGLRPLNVEQRRVVDRFQHFSEAWSLQSEIKASDLGRVAAKQESIENLLSRLSFLSDDSQAAFGDYAKRKPRGPLPRPLVSKASVVGRLQKVDISGAQEIIASRIKMSGFPSFDPEPFLDETVSDLYRFPLKHALNPTEAEAPPRVRVHAKFHEKLSLLHLLEQSGRLAFRSGSEVKVGYGNGLFTVPKDLSVDRLILDARPANVLQHAPQRYVMCMASSASLINIVLDEHEQLLMSGDDLSNFFYTFKASPERVTRNFLSWKIPVSAVKHMKSFPSHLLEEPFVYACLATLAMGDSAACEYAQASHVSLGLQACAFLPDQLLTIHGRVPRDKFFCGIIIDDLILLQKVARGAVEGDRLNTARAAMHKIYASVGLEAHPSKGFSNSSSASFWGADVCGTSGFVRATVCRAISLIWVTLQVIRLGVCSISLLEVLCGGFVSLFTFRRRMMSLIDVCYRIQSGRERCDIIRLPDELNSEMWGLILLAPLAVAELRARCTTEIFAVDASNWGEAVVKSSLSPSLAKEVHRHGLTKGSWTKLLSPFKAHERAAGHLDVCDELPEGETPFTEHLVWETAVRGLPFELVWKKRATKERHINIGELRSFVKAEIFSASGKGPVRVPILCDSQVTLGCTVKGRSASPALNRELQKSLAHVLGYGIYSTGAYARSAHNPADDPTRGCRVRAPTIELPDWWLEASEGNFRNMDLVLAQAGLGSFEIAGIPNLYSLLPRGDKLEPYSNRLTRMHKRVKEKLTCRLKSKSETDVVEPANTLTKSPWPIEVQDALMSFPKEAFFVAEGVPWPPTRPGFLDLYSGVKGFAKACLSCGAPWVLCIDILDGPFSDLLDVKVRHRLELLIKAGVFLHVSAAPICSSFSRAITPNVRDSTYPRGCPWVMGSMKVRLQQGNSHSDWLGLVISICISQKIGFWVENPDSSFLWQQRVWRKLGASEFSRCFRCDFCVFGTRWRKRTRFFTDGRLAGVRKICSGGHQHLVLRGRSVQHKMAWTKVAEPYPRKLCMLLAWSTCSRYNFSKPIPGLCCKAQHRRIGEAKNPGPRRMNFGPRHCTDLDEINLIRPETRKLGAEQWDQFCTWASNQIGPAAFSSSQLVPELLGMVLASYGRHWYETGGSLFYYRHLLVHLQRKMPICRGRIQVAWEVVTRWEILQPIEHRRPLPLKVLEAMVVVSLLWKWHRVACVLLSAFHGCCRPGEVLRASRKDFVLPADLGSPDDGPVFVRINSPKSKLRGLGKIQHVKIDHPGVSVFLQSMLGSLSGEDKIYPGTPGTFRRRWNILLQALSIPSDFRLTPGSLRPGGTVALYRKGVAIHDILWALRLKHLETLQHYLQEVSTDMTLFDLPREAKDAVTSLAFCLPLFLSNP